MVSALANNSSSIQVILHEDEEQSKHHDEGGGLEDIIENNVDKKHSRINYLVMELEQKVVNDEIISFEPLEKAADEGQPIDDGWGRHGDWLVFAKVSLPWLAAADV